MRGWQARLAARLDGRLSYSWVVAAAIFVALLISAGVRSMPGVLLVPLQQDLGWSRTAVSLAISIGIALYGLVGPFAAAVMQRFGVRRAVIGALLLMALSVASTTLVARPWQLVLTWGLLSGIATGTIANVLGATIVARWFVRHRGVAMGLMAASVSTGQLVFLPAFAWMIDRYGWRDASLVVAVLCLMVLPLIFILVPERPASIGQRALGAVADEAPRSIGNPLGHAFSVLATAARVPLFWLLFGSFFVCGLSTNGLVGTHFIALCLDHGIPALTSAGLLAMIGLFDLFGTTGSGWLSDRYDNKLLLAWYYGLRGLSLIALVYGHFSFVELGLFTAFYGLDWIATIPPTLRLTAARFGDADAPILFGWIAAGHQLGAAAAAIGAGWMRSELDSYLLAFLLAGTACLAVALILVLSSWTTPRRASALAGSQ
jgi:predicted MFS family arabinose efflux permease